MTKQEQIEEIAKYICNVCEMGHGFNGDCSEGGTDHYKHCTLTQETAEALYEEGYRKVPDGAVVLTPEERGDEIRETDEIIKERNNLLARVGVLGREVEELKAKLKECDVVDDYTIGFATYLMQKRRDEVDRLQSEIKRLKKENEQLKAKLEARLTCDFVKARQNYAVQNFAEKLRKRLTEDRVSNDNVVINANYEIDELLKEYKE